MSTFFLDEFGGLRGLGEKHLFKPPGLAPQEARSPRIFDTFDTSILWILLVLFDTFDAFRAFMLRVLS